MKTKGSSRLANVSLSRLEWMLQRLLGAKYNVDHGIEVLSLPKRFH